jgi:hypothetical protein
MGLAGGRGGGGGDGRTQGGDDRDLDGEVADVDAVGRVRATDNNKPVDPVSDYVASDGTVLKLTGARDVGVHAAESQAGQAGFVRNLFHSLVKQPPAAYSPELVGRLTDKFRADGFHVRNLAIEVAVVAALRPTIANAAPTTPVTPHAR